MIRPPFVAGQFYPGNARAVEAELDRWMPPIVGKHAAIGLVCPHAGWMYSGRTAGIGYASVRVPDRVILIGPNHRGFGSPYAMYDTGTWRIPGGDVPIAEPLAAKLLDRCRLLTSDPHAHRNEHCLEVQVPMLRRANPNVQIVPVLIGAHRQLREIGESIAGVVKDSAQPVLLVASSDLNHYEDQNTANRKDKLALDALVSLDEEMLMNRVAEHDISMCGVAAAYIVLVAAKRLGAQRAEVLDYRTSGDVNGDSAAVVGYAAVVLE